MSETNHSESMNEEQGLPENLSEDAITQTKEDGGEYTSEEIIQQKHDELYDKYIRLYAEFDNFRNRTHKERFEMRDAVTKDVLLAMLPVYDDIKRAIAAEEKTGDAEVLKNGVGLILSKFKHVLTMAGVTEMEAKGKEFNSDLFDAITTIPAPTPDMKGKVIDDIETGYMINDKVLRFAKVVVGE
ncbi:MAG: nucleotide exchange factor GrpE [Bacteroidetes bacterium]|nr:nucleotide exchange factor GrpE [Bacteroidota bacterium]